MVDVGLFVCFGGFRVPEEDPENTVAACSLLQLSRNASHTEYACAVDMTELLADIKVQVDVTEMADGQRVISKSFYMAENSKYKNGGFERHCLTLWLPARVVQARRERGLGLACTHLHRMLGSYCCCCKLQKHLCLRLSLGLSWPQPFHREIPFPHEAVGDKFPP